MGMGFKYFCKIFNFLIWFEKIKKNSQNLFKSSTGLHEALYAYQALMNISGRMIIFQPVQSEGLLIIFYVMF